LVHVHIDTRKVVQLYRRPAGGSGFVHACQSPCDMELPLGDEYHLIGSGISQTKDFHLQGSQDDQVTLTVNGPSAGGMLAGGTLAVGGSIAMYMGALAALSGLGETCGSTSSYSCGASDGDRKGGLIAFVVGTAAAALGTYVLINAASTDVNQGAAASPAAASNDAFVREAMWRTPTSAEGARLDASAVTLPLRFSF
jgi:hypothetical protein